jgi:hypothetical protein
MVSPSNHEPAQAPFDPFDRLRVRAQGEDAGSPAQAPFDRLRVRIEKRVALRPVPTQPHLLILSLSKDELTE